MLCHRCRLRNAHQIENRWRDIAQNPIVDLFQFRVDQNNRYRIRRVCGIRTSIRVDHRFAIAMVGDNDGRVAIFQSGSNDFFDALIDRFTGFDRGFENAGVAYHIAVGKIETHKIDFFFLEFRNKRIGEFERAHFGLQIIGGDFRGIS